MTERNPLPLGMTPRLLTKEAAAAYCSMSPDAFEARIRPHVPALDISARPLLWDIKALDRWLDEQSGIAGALPSIDELIGMLGSNDRANSRR